MIELLLTLDLNTFEIVRDGQIIGIFTKGYLKLNQFEKLTIVELRQCLESLEKLETKQENVIELLDSDLGFSEDAATLIGENLRTTLGFEFNQDDRIPLPGGAKSSLGLFRVILGVIKSTIKK